MGCSELLILGLLLNVAQCLESLGKEQQLEITNNVTAILGQDVYLNCTYVGKDEIVMAEWKREVDGKSKRLVGFMNNKPFSRDADFSSPASVTDLTVRMAVSSVNAEGEYTCEFVSDNKDIHGTVFLTVVAEPSIHIQVKTETVNGTHYQSVSCLAVAARPTPEVSWLVNGLPPPQDIFTVEQNKTAHPNGTSTLSSVLRFPTHLQDEDSVTCVVQHPTLPNPALTTARVDTFVRPNVSIKAEMIRQRGSEYWVVSCVASGGRPNTNIILAVDSNEELQRDNYTGLDSQIHSVHLPVARYEGHNVTCVFEHPKFTHSESQVITLPTFYLSGAQLLLPGVEDGSGKKTTDALELIEGQMDVLVRMNVTGNVPSYTVTCSKDAGPLPEDLRLVGSDLSVEGPVSPHHSGLYECVFSFHHHTATLQFNITVKAPPVAPSIRVDLWSDGGRSVIECSAADAVPVADVSWLLPEGVSAESRFDFTSHNGSHSVRGLVLLPACTPRELTAQCVINHPAFQKPQNRRIKLPLCARPNITLSSSPEWREGEAYTKVDCSVESVAPAAAITWKLGNSSTLLSETGVSEVQSDGSVSTRSSVHFLSALYSGQNLSCVVEHLSLETPEERALHITEHKAPELRASVNRPQGSSLWTAECVCSGQGVGTNLTWLLPEHLQKHTSLEFYTEGSIETVRLIYLFPLSLHEDQDLTCVHHSEHGLTQRGTVHVRQYSRLNISLSSSPEWREGEAYTKVDCYVESIAPAAAITWKLGNSDNHSSTLLSETRVSEVQSDGSVSTRSSVHVLSALYSGQNLSCVVEHLSLQTPEERALHITEHKAPELRASVNRPQGSSLWTAECVCSGQGVGTNLTWLLPEHLQKHTSLDFYTEGSIETVRLIYLFPLSLHEDQDLTCVHHSEYGLTQRRTVHLPQYYISLKVVNHTTPLQNRYGVDLGIRRLTLQESLHNQRIVLQVEGNVPDYTLTCRRQDGSFVQMEGAAMLFHSELTRHDEGLYTCRAYFCHHTAAVSIQVEVTSEEKLFVIGAISCISSALALALMLAVVLWVLCKINARKQCKKRESLSALTTLMQEPGSPEGKGPVVVEKDGKEYAQLVNYSIVFDVKSTV